MKIVTQEGTPESVGRAAAIGLFMGFILPVGLQTFPALGLAFLFKANKALTWLFTCISNPATIFILYPIQCYTGSLLLFNPLDYDNLTGKFDAIAGADGFMDSLNEFSNLGLDIILSFFAGGLFYGVLFAAGGYVICKKLVTAYRIKREERRKAKLERNPATSD